MSFFNRLGTLAKDLGGAAVAPIQFVWDVGTAPWNDSEQFNGFSNTLKSSATKFITSTVKPLSDIASMAAPALQKIDDVNQQLVRRPLTAALLTAQGAPGGWERAYQEANKNVSFGQAAATFIGSPFMQDSFDIYDQKQRDEMFKKNMLGKLTSGTLDLGIDVFGDVTIVGGKAAKALRASKYVTDTIKSADDIERIGKDIYSAIRALDPASGVARNKYNDFADIMVNADAFTASNHPLVKNSSHPNLLASAFGVTKTPQDSLNVLLASIGDRAALDALNAKHAHVVDAFNTALGNQRLMDDFLANPDAFVLRTDLDEFGKMLPEAAKNQERWDSLYAREKEIVESTKRDFPEMEAILGIGQQVKDEGWLLSRTIGQMQTARGFDKALMKVRTDASTLAKSGEKDIPNRAVRIFQSTPYNGVIQAVHFATGEKPAGIFNFEDVDSTRELVAQTSLVLKIADGSTAGKYARQTFDKKTGEITGGIVSTENGKYKFIDQNGISSEVEGLTQERARQFLNDYTNAASAPERMKVAENFERFAFEAIAAKHGVDSAYAKEIYRNAVEERTSLMRAMRQHGFGIDKDGSKVMSPIYESQTANFMPMTDFELLDRVLGQKDMPKLLHQIANAKEGTITFANVLNDMFKAGALLRLGYTMRNTVEAQLRIAATLGSFGSMRFLGEGAKNLMLNTSKRSGRFIDDVRGVPNRRAALLAERTRLQSANKVAEYRDKLAKLPDNIEGQAARAQIENMITEHLAIIEANSPERAAMVLKGIGQGKVNVVSKYTLTDGTKAYAYDDAFSGPLAGLRERLVSAESSRIRLVNETAEIISDRMKPVGWGPIRPEEPHYWSEWANSLNTIFRNSQIVRKLAAGESKEDVAKWLRSVEGRPVRKMLGLNLDEVDGHMDIAYQMFNDHLPSDEFMAAVLSKELFTADSVKKLAEKINNLQPIQGNLIKEVYTGESQNMIRQFVNGAFRLIGTMPEDKLARMPFYTMSYRNALQRITDKVEYLRFRDANGKVVERLSEDQLFKIQQAAHREALKEMKKTLFNIERRTNMASAMHLVMPFFSAYENSIKTWSRIAYNNPQIAMRGYYAFTAPNRMGIATDQDGNPVPVEKASMDDTIWLSIPSSFAKIPVIGKGLEPFTTQKGMRVMPDGTTQEVTVGGLGINKRSLDVVFGGGLDLPIGPYVAMPVSAIVKEQPDLESTFKWALPYGPTDPNSMLPTWLRRQIDKSQGESSGTYANFFSMIWQTEMQKFRDGLRDKPTAEEIKSMTNAYFNMHSIANLVLPFAPKFDTPYRFYIDQYRQMQKEGFVQRKNEDGTVETLSPQDRFYQEFGEDFFGFTASLSSNTTGSKASVSSVARAKKYAGLIADIAADDPKLIGIITDDGKTYEFSKAAYTWQQENAIAPGSKTRFREKGDPAEADKRNRAQLGWIKFNQEKTQLDMELAQRGLTSYESKYAQDLKDRKDAMIKDIATSYPDWYDDYLDTDGSKTRRVIRGLTKIVSGQTEASQQFMSDNRNNTTWKSVMVYLSVRQQVQEQLKYRQSKSLDAKSNIDLKIAWDNAVNALTRGDIGFEDMYNRFLTQDPVWDKVEVGKGV